MTRRISAVSIVVLLLVTVGLAQDSQPAMKGYELYSWKVKKKWHYSLLRATSRAMSREEIVSNPNIRIGDGALREEFRKLGKGEEVFWMSDAPEGVDKPTGKHSTGFKHPSRKRIERLIAYCNKIGVKLTLR